VETLNSSDSTIPLKKTNTPVVPNDKQSNLKLYVIIGENNSMRITIGGIALHD